MRLDHLLKKLAANTATWQLYHEQFQEYIRKLYVAQAYPNFTGTPNFTRLGSRGNIDKMSLGFRRIVTLKRFAQHKERSGSRTKSKSRAFSGTSLV